MGKLKYILIFFMLFLFSACASQTKSLDPVEQLSDSAITHIKIPESELDKVKAKQKVDTSKRVVVDNRDGHISELPQEIGVWWPQDQYKIIVANQVRWNEIEKIAKKLEEENIRLVILSNSYADALKGERLLREKERELTNIIIAQKNELASQFNQMKIENTIIKLGIIAGVIFLVVGL